MPVKIGGLPAHPLIVHAVVVLLPLAAVMLVLGALWPAARHKFGILTPLVALAGLVLVPVATNAGEWLEDRLPSNRALKHHAELGRQLLPWAAGLFVMATVVWWVGRRRELSWRPGTPRQTEVTPSESLGSGGADTATLTRAAPATASRQAAPVWMTAVLAVLSVGVAVGMSILLYRIGDSGAHLVWDGVGSNGG